MLPLADAFAQKVSATLWTFSMRAVDVGALLLSAWLDIILYRRRFRVKDWPYSQAVKATVCDFVCLTLEVATLCLFVILCRAGCVGREEARFELPLACCRLLMRLRRWYQQRCGHFQCEQWTLEHCCSQHGSSLSCSDVASESRIGHIFRRCTYRFRFVILF